MRTVWFNSSLYGGSQTPNMISKRKWFVPIVGYELHISGFRQVLGMVFHFAPNPWFGIQSYL